MEAAVLTNNDVVNHVRRSAERERAVLRDSEIPVLDPVDRVQENESLAYLNRSWQLDRASSSPSAGAFWRLRAWLKAKAAGIIESVLGKYFQQERDFLANLVRVQNELARRIDRLAQEVRILDGSTYRFAGAFREACADLRERDEVLRRLFERRLAEIEERKAS